MLCKTAPTANARPSGALTPPRGEGNYVGGAAAPRPRLLGFASLAPKPIRSCDHFILEGSIAVRSTANAVGLRKLWGGGAV